MKEHYIPDVPTPWWIKVIQVLIVFAAGFAFVLEMIKELAE